MADLQSWDEIVRNKIGGRMHDRLVQNDDFSFITLENLRHVWESSAAQFQEMQDAIKLQFDEARWPYTDFMQVISIFVMIHTRNWSHVGKLLQSGFKDSLLPITLSNLSTHWFTSIANSSVTVREFHTQQYAFCPIIIKEGRHVPCEDRHARLPFVEESDLGAGSFGTVTKVKIAKGYLIKRKNGRDVRSTNETTAARKRFRVAVDGRIEQGVLDRLRKERWQNDCIMSSFASVNLGSLSAGECEFNLFFPYAPADLYKFLFESEGSHQLLGITTENITPRALFSEVLNLVDALRYLHREDLRMCHSDLKLDNILIVPCDGHPIGKWKITDFGIASIEPREPSRAQGWGDVMSMTFATRTSIRSSGRVTNNDQREKGPFQPPEVENINLIPPGALYRAKGDIWSLGCISVYVFVYALGGKSLIARLNNILHAASRDDGRKGYLYSFEPNNNAVLFVDMQNWIQALALYWDNWALESTLSFHPWAQDVWSKIIVPMLTPAVLERTTADELFKRIEGLIKYLLPSRNIWDAPISPDMTATRSAEEAYPSAFSMAEALASIPMSSSLPPRSVMRPARSSLTIGRARMTGRGSTAGTRPRFPTKPADVAVVRVQPIPEEVGGPSGSTSQSSTGPRSIPVPPHVELSSSPEPFMGNPTTCDLKSSIPENLRAVQVTDNGARVIFLTTNCVISFVLTSSRGFWTRDDMKYVGAIPNFTWHSLYLAGPFLCLRGQVATVKDDSCLRLFNLSSQPYRYRREWDGSLIGNLANMSLFTLSSKGHVAFRATSTLVSKDYDSSATVLELYDNSARLLLSWDLKKVTYPSVAQTRGNIEAIAFDPTGEYIVATAYDCWYMWEIDAIRDDGIPNRYGNHNYTPRECFNSICSLQVFPGGRHFLLHDQCQSHVCIIIDTNKGTVQQQNLGGLPKSQTITVSMTGGWLAYLVQGNIKDYLYYHQLRSEESDGNTTVSLGPAQKQKLDKIKTKTVDRGRVVDSVVRIVSSEASSHAVVASITKVVEMIPLDITPAPVKRRWF